MATRMERSGKRRGPKRAEVVLGDEQRAALERWARRATTANALAQRAHANVNCRMFPGATVEETHNQIVKVVDDPKIAVSVRPPQSVTPAAPPLTREILGPVETVAGKMWPGVPLIPAMSTGATDGKYLNAAGIPTYGLTGLFGDPDGNGVHGLNERIRVRSLYEGRDFLYEVVKLYANQ